MFRLLRTHASGIERRVLLTMTSALLAWPLLHAGETFGQEKPALKIIVGFAPGGAVDTLARIVADGMRDDFSSVIVDNRPGAAGRLALGQIKRQKPDGLTLIIAPDPGFTLFPHLFKKLDYDPVHDFTPISQLASMPYAVTTVPAVGVNSVREMAAKAQASPATATIGTSGSGSAGHVIGAWLSQMLGVEFNAIPFQGGAPANIAMLGGTVAYRIDALSETVELHRTGKARILAVTGATRSRQLPDVPTLKEQGIDLVINSWMGLYAPANLPKDRLEQLSSSVVRAVKSKAVTDKLIERGFEPAGSSPGELAAIQRSDLALWEKPAKATGLSLD